MPKKNDSWGIEVGSNAIKAIRLVRSGSEVELADYEILPFKKILTTPDLNVDEAIRMNLDQFTSKHELGRSSVVLSVPGNMAFARFAKLPPVEPKKIPDIVRFEAVQQIPFPIEEVEWDYQVFQQEDAPDVEVGIFAISKERVAKFLSNYRHLNINVDALTLSPIAVYNAFHYENQGTNRNHGTVYLDIGTVSTDVIIVQNDGIWLRTLPIGGNNFTEALVRAFKLSFPKAEKLKREASTSKYARQIFQAMRPVFADLVQELQRSLGYYQSINREADIKRVVGAGSTFRLPGLQKFLKQQLQMEVIRPDGFKRIAVEGRREADFAENALNMATAYGLALQGLGLDTVSANLLPSHILQSRMWRAKQPWIAAASACLVVGAALSGARYYASASAYQSAVNSTSVPIKAILNQAQQYKNKLVQISQNSNPTQQIENVRGTLDYRALNADIYKTITAAINAYNPPPVMMNADYSAIEKIPRQQRKRIYIDQIQTVYNPRAATASSTNNPNNTSTMVANSSTDQTSSVLGVTTSVQTLWQNHLGPELVITIIGTTPYAKATRLLNQVVNYLNKAGQHDQLLFRTVKVNLGNLQLVGSQQNSNSSNFNNGFNGGGASSGFNSQNPNSQNLNSQTTLQDTDNVADLMLHSPLATEDRSQDQRFTITWTIQLKKPDQVRQVESVPAPPSKTTKQSASRNPRLDGHNPGQRKDGQS